MRTVAASSRAFTLIELLVVIVIIALLVATLLPTLAAARDQARQSACGSNLHQMAISTTAYLGDFNDTFWRYRSGTTGGVVWWFGFELGGPGVGVDRPLDKTRSVLAPYQSTVDDEFNCPSFPYDTPDFFRKFERRGASYGYNLRLGPLSTTLPTKRLPDLTGRETTTFVFADAIHYDFGPTFNEGHYIAYTANAAGPSGYGHFRHRGVAQVLFIDGHVANQRLLGPAYRITAGSASGNLASPDGSNRIYGP